MADTETQDTTQQAPGWFPGLLGMVARPAPPPPPPAAPTATAAPAEPVAQSPASPAPAPPAAPFAAPRGPVPKGLGISPMPGLGGIVAQLPPPPKMLSDPFSDFLIEQGHATLERHKTIDAAIDKVSDQLDKAQKRGDKVAADNLENKRLRLRALKDEWDPTPRPTPPEYAELPPVPSGKALPVFGPRPDATVSEALQHTISDLGLMIQMAVGVGKGFGIGASAAFEGAMHGAAEGNRIRFETEMRRYNAEVARIKNHNENQAQEFHDKVTLRAWDEQDWKHKATLFALENDLGDEAVKLAQEDPARLQARLNELVHISDKLDTNLTHLNTTMGQHETHLRQGAADAEKRRHNLVMEGRAGAAGAQPVGQGAWIDRDTGTLTTPTKDQFAKNPDRYRHLGASEEQMYTNVVTGQQMIRDLGPLVDTLLGKYTPDNLAKGLEGKVSTALRNDPNWAQFLNLVNESNIELARVVGGSGQLRVTVLQMLREAGISGMDTRDVAHRILGTINTSLENRKNSIRYGGDTTKMQPYGVSPMESNQPGGKAANDPLGVR
jgi:hypothetical protein